MRRPHLLTPTRRNNRPHRLIFFDTETKQTELVDNRSLHTLKLGVAHLYEYTTEKGMIFREEHLITDPASFWSWVDAQCWKRVKTYIIAHNIVFDLSVLGGFKRLADMGWSLTGLYAKYMIGIFRWSKGRYRLQGLDNSNFYKGKLDKWGKIVGYPKLDVDFETVSDADLLIYCRRDVKIMALLWEMWFDFIDSHDCGAFKPTIASTAFNTWRRRFMPDTVYIHSDQDALALEREAYRGARTECLWVGESEAGPFYYLDFNNMYGYVMQKHTYPNYMVSFTEDGSLDYLEKKITQYDVIAQVTLELDEPWFAQKSGGFTCYPIGQFETTLTTPELKLCIDKDWIRSVGSVACYRSADLFYDYVHEFRQAREEYDAQELEGYSEICKLLVNALYGKFGQRGFHQKMIGECPPDVVKTEYGYDEVADRHFNQVYLGGRIYQEYREGESHNSFPAICAHVTAYARMHLYGLVREVPEGHVFYMDTDSMIVDQVGYKALKPYIDKNALGALKVEVKSPWLKVYAPKDYAMQGRSKTKGVKKNAVEIEPGVFAQTQFMRLQGMIREGITEGFMTREITKTQRRVIHSGEVLPSGQVLPFRFQEVQS